LLLREHVETYEQLEVLLLLHRDRNRTWNADAAGTALSLSPEAAADALDHLYGRGLLAMAPSGSARLFRYALTRGHTDEAVARLAREYGENRLEIIKLMSAYAIERVRTAAIRAFAVAFVLRRKEQDDT
jgi:hypothetical protein